jgi:hypothetical protein
VDQLMYRTRREIIPVYVQYIIYTAAVAINVQHMGWDVLVFSFLFIYWSVLQSLFNIIMYIPYLFMYTTTTENTVHVDWLIIEYRFINYLFYSVVQWERPLLVFSRFFLLPHM